MLFCQGCTPYGLKYFIWLGIGCKINSILASQDMPVVITFQATRAIPEEQVESKFVCSCLKTAKNMF